MKEKLKKIYNNFGLDNQLKKQREEHIEAAEASADFATTLWLEADPLELAYYREHLIEEMADAHIMDMQIIHALSAEEEFKQKVEEKIQRTLDRIETGYYDHAED